MKALIVNLIASVRIWKRWPEVSRSVAASTCASNFCCLHVVRLELAAVAGLELVLLAREFLTDTCRVELAVVLSFHIWM